MQLNYTTILYLTNKELNKDPLVCLEQYLQREPATAGDDEDEDKKSAGFLHEKLFGERANVQELLNEECKTSNLIDLWPLAVSNLLLLDKQ